MTMPADARLELIRSIAQRCRPDGSDLDKCVPVTRMLVTALREAGIDAIGMRLEGARNAMPGAHATWLAIEPERWVHYIAWLPLERIAVDATGGQFGLPPVRIITREEIDAEWREALELS